MTPLPDVTMVHFVQCLLGQTSVKPTALLCICAPQVAALINEAPNQSICNHPCEHRKPDKPLGRNPDGTWETARAMLTRRSCASYSHKLYIKRLKHDGATWGHLRNGQYQTSTSTSSSRLTRATTCNGAPTACAAGTSDPAPSKGAAESP